MYERFTDRARKVMQLANQEAQRFNHEYIGTEHILLGVIKEGSGVAANVLKNLELDLIKIRLEVEKIVQSGPDMITMAKLPQTPRARKVIEYALEEARNLKHQYVGTEHLLLGLIREEEGVAALVLMSLGLKLTDVREEVMNLLGQKIDAGTQTQSQTWQPRDPLLGGFGVDLTELAWKGKLDPILGREEEINRVLRILCRRDKNCPVLVGEMGIGKLSIVMGVAERIAHRFVPPPLADQRLVALDVPMLAASSVSWDRLVDKLMKIVNEVRQAKRRMIVLLNDMHASGRYGDAWSALSVALSDVNLKWVGTTTPAAYAALVEKESVLNRWLQPITVLPASKELTLEILHSQRSRYETHHTVRISDQALQAAVEMSSRIARGCLPEKALDIIDEAGAKVRLSFPVHPLEFKEIDGKLEQLNQGKEAAVADQDFDKAAAMRDQADELKKQKEKLLQEHSERMREAAGIVDETVIATVVEELTRPVRQSGDADEPLVKKLSE